MSKIVGFDACKAALESLIGEARADLSAKKDGDPAAYEAAVSHWERRLFEFVQDSRPAPGETDAIQGLDDQAIRIAEEIRQTQKHEIVTRIDALSREIEEAGKQIGAQALSNMDAAKRGRLLPIKNAIDSLAGAVNQVKVLKKDLDGADPDEQKILSQIETLIGEIDAVKASFAAL